MRFRDLVAELTAYTGAALIVAGLAFGLFPLLAAGGLVFIPATMFLGDTNV